MRAIAYHFWSPTCAPCKAIKPALDDLKEEFSQVTWISVNIQEDPQNLALKYGVKVVPTIVTVKINEFGNPVKVDNHTGTNMMGYYRLFRSATQPE